jgi:carbon monoxide dehydrogenase subunit G
VDGVVCHVWGAGVLRAAGCLFLSLRRRHHLQPERAKSMDMTGTQHIEAPRDVVWTALNDVEVLRQAIPGCQSIEKISDTEMNAKVVLKVGPVKATFTGKVTLSDLDPPNGYTITGEGSGGAAGFAKGSATVRLVETTGSTDLHYEVKAQIGGKLAQLGSRLIDSTAKKLAGDFFEKFGDAVAPPTETAAADAATPEKKKGWFRSMLGR